MRISTYLASLLAAIALSACGGGGSSSTPVPPAPAAITSQPAAQSVTAGQSVTFTVAASGSGLTYQWQRNGADVAGATAASYTFTPQLADNGSSWTVIVKSGISTLASTPAILTVKAAPGITLFAGALGGQGNLDGKPGRLFFARAVAVAPNGVVYLPDNGRMRTATMGTDGTATLATAPGLVIDGRTLAIDADGNRYDLFGRSVRKTTPAGVESFVAGVADQLGNADGMGTAARFGDPGALAFDKVGNLYVTDLYYRSVRKIAPSGATTTLATGVDVDRYISVDGAGNVLVATATVLRRIAPNGTVSVLAGVEQPAGALATPVDGSGSAARFGSISGVAADADGTVYVSDSGLIRKVTAAGVVTTLAGKTGPCKAADGKGNQACLDGLAGLALDKAGNLFAACSEVLRKITPDGTVSTVSGKAAEYDVVNGSLVSPPLNFVRGLAIDSKGEVLALGDVVYKVGKDGSVKPAGLATVTPAGSPIRYFLAGANFGGSMVAFSGGAISRVNADGSLTWLAGKEGDMRVADGSAAEARFNSVAHAQFDTAGNLYLYDAVRLPNASHMQSVLRKLTPAGVVSTVQQTSYLLDSVDARGNSHVLEANTAKFGQDLVRLAPDGTRTVLLFYGYGGIDAVPVAIAVDRDGNVYVAEGSGGTSVVVRKVKPDGSSSIILGKAGSYGVELGPLPGSLAQIQAMAVDKDGVLYIASEQAILRITQ
ncbi:NHL domain-containing protein [Pseudoduganella sp. OTU4001]|uniref:NHL domain-containing protein n=1 Tax=Pseudoduganella sp. OTU4001 TaxID=3043854 RepID=UPI00313BF0C0